MRATLAADETMRVRIHAQAAAALHTRTLGIGDRGMRAAGVFDFAANLDRSIDIRFPRMPQVEVGEIRPHQRRVGQARAGIGLGVTRDCAGLRNRRLDRRRFQIGGGRTTLALAEIHGESETAVAIALDGFDFIQPHVDRQSGTDAGRNLRLRSARGARAADHVLCELREAVEFRHTGVGCHNVHGHFRFPFNSG